MINSDNTIVRPVTITDVKTVLGESTTKLSELCTSDKINVFARYRPLGGGTPTQKPNDTSNAINIQESLWSPSDIVATGPNPGKSWVKAPITPWYRLGDFDGYYHATKAPIYRDKQDYYINKSLAWNTQNKVKIDFTNYAGNNLADMAVITAQGVTIKPYDMYAYMTIYTKSGSNYVPYSTATNHILSKQKIGSNGNYIEIPELPDGQYYFTLELDSLAIGNYRYTAGFPVSAGMNKIASLKVETVKQINSSIVGWRESWLPQTSYRNETNTDTINVNKSLVVSYGSLGINFKVEITNLTSAPITISLYDFNIKSISSNTIYIITNYKASYPSRDRSGVSDPSTYNSTNNTLTIPANHTTYINMLGDRPITSSTSLPSGPESDSYQLNYKNTVQYTNSKTFTVTG